MAIETLKDIKKLGAFELIVMDDLREKYPERFTETGAMDHKWFEETIRPVNFVYVRKDKHSLAFTLQNGPVKENGVNGCQVDTIIQAAMQILIGFNRVNPCPYNQGAIEKLDEALMWLALRKKDRTDRGVEGTSSN